MQSLLKNVVNITCALVQIPSESSDLSKTNGSPETGVVKFLEELCKKHNIAYSLQEVKASRQNFIINFPKEGAKKILITAHMDTVGAKNMPEPFEAKIKDNKIMGRGACDDKGSLASILAALIYLKENEIPLEYDLTLVGTVDEECTMAGSAKLAATNPKGWDLCLAMEPSLLQPISTHIGVYRCRILPSTPEQSDHKKLSTAAEIIQKLLPQLEEAKNLISADKHPKLGHAQVTITEIKDKHPAAGKQANHRILVDTRLLPSQSPREIHQTILKAVGALGKVIPLFAGFGIDSPPTAPIIQAFQKSLLNLGMPERLIAVPFPSDCSQLYNKGTCLVWGPGNPEHAHTNIEHIDIDQLEKACLLLIDFLREK